LALSLTTLFAASTSTREKSPAFPQETSDLKADPAARFGKLPNGLRYIILPNPEPKGRASLRLLVLADSFQEAEDQRGIADFLEHMASNGSVHNRPGRSWNFSSGWA